ncbi:DUF4082 domain-containing protein [Aquabacterium sp.]|uniref:DUF4082 domain-containing protein n=1 Tax=Aquabacterium sp. TaxID=1872578 RepID=UPI002CC2C5A0|nr:DUF4082 domain-containing protein [Aquabacterium sp.]HSW05446.1 DUF4082 domain-containing protein [Aquabacterium sp.]
MAAALTLVLTGLVVPLAQAAEAPAYAFTGSGIYFGDAPVTVGFIFTAQQAMPLSALGFYDHQQDGLNQAHELALFSSSGTLLATATVAAGTSAPLIGEYRYATLGSTFMLQADTQYVLAAQTEATDGYRFASAPLPTLTVDPRITIGNSAGVYHYGPSLVFPQTVLYDIYASPNMLLPAVPEPGTWALMLAGVAAVAGLVRRRRALIAHRD